MNPELITQTILAIDHGERRIGLAIKPAGEEIVLPLKIVDAEREDAAMEEIRGIIAGREVDIVVAGLPLASDPTQAQRVKRFTRRLRSRIKGVRWRFVDESLTSEKAHELERAVRTAGRAKPIDDMAAALILETFIDSPGPDSPA